MLLLDSIEVCSVAMINCDEWSCEEDVENTSLTEFLASEK